MAASPKRSYYDRVVTKSQWVGLVGLVVNAAAVGVITLTHADSASFHRGFARRVRRIFTTISPAADFTGTEFNFVTNVIMFVPLGFFLGLLLSRRRQWIGFLVLPAASALIEGIQYFMPTRGTQLDDLIANSIGGWVGLSIAIAGINIRGQLKQRNAPAESEDSTFRRGDQ